LKEEETIDDILGALTEINYDLVSKADLITHSRKRETRG
jgi:hypothetical protein